MRGRDINDVRLVLKEAGDLAEAVCEAAGNYLAELSGADCVAGYWNTVNDAKEYFWEVTAKEVSGETAVWDNGKLCHTLEVFSEILGLGIAKAGRLGRDVRPTYFYYHVTDWEETEEGIWPLSFEVMNSPDFLEGSVHSLKIASDYKEKKEIYDSVQELLKAGLYTEFMEDFKQAAVPFLSEETYGRSPNPKYHGKGFVARLSGSTAEFLEMWEILMFGRQPFTVEAGELKLAFSPCIPEYLIGESRRLECTFLGIVPVIYELSDMGALVPGDYRIREIRIAYEGGEECWEEAVCGAAAAKVRAGNVQSITVKIAR